MTFSLSAARTRYIHANTLTCSLYTIGRCKGSLGFYKKRERSQGFSKSAVRIPEDGETNLISSPLTIIVAGMYRSVLVAAVSGVRSLYGM